MDTDGVYGHEMNGGAELAASMAVAKYGSFIALLKNKRGML